MAEISVSRVRLADVDAAQWDALAAVGSVNTIFQTYAWHQAWWAAREAQHELALIRAVENDRLVGLAPLVVDSGGVLRFLGYGASDYLDFLIEDRRLDVRHALELEIGKLGWKRILLEQIHEDSVLRGQQFAMPSIVEVQQPAPSYRFRHDSEDAKLANKKSLKRHFNYFQKNGILRFEVLESAGDVEPHLEIFFDQHVQRRAATSASSRFHDASEREFYLRLTRNLGASGHLRFCVLHFDEDILAYHFGFVFKNTSYWYKPTFNMAYEKHSPGEVLIKMIIEDCISRGYDELDFTIGGEAFKYRFANQQRLVFQLIGFRSRASMLFHILRRRVKNQIRSLRGAQASGQQGIANPDAPPPQRIHTNPCGEA